MTAATWPVGVAVAHPATKATLAANTTE